MAENPRDDKPMRRRKPTPDFFASFGFSVERGIYLPQSIIDEDRPDRQEKRRSKDVLRMIRRSLPYLTLLVPVANAVIYSQQCGIMGTQSHTLNAQATILATQVAAQERFNRETLPQMEAQASAARTAADAAVVSVNQAVIANRNTENALRTEVKVLYVGCSPDTFGLNTAVWVRFKNFGKSPAQAFQYVAYVGNPNLNLRIPLREKPSVIDIPAGGEAGTEHMTLGEALGTNLPQLFQPVFNGDAPLEIWGTTQYRDILGSQTGSFRFRYEPKSACGFRILSDK